MAEDVTIPGEPAPTQSAFLNKLAIAASALTAASIAVNLILQVAHFMNKRPVQPDQRDKVQAAGLGLTVLKTIPGLVRQVRMLNDQIRR